jgi:hypothetical protein
MESAFTGWYAEKAKEWAISNSEMARSFNLPSWSNRAIYPKGREDEEILLLERTLPEDVFMERFAGIPCPLSQLVTKEFRNEVHIGSYPFNPELPVELAIDPGYSGAYAVLAVQWAGEQGFVVDEIYLQGLITEEIIQLCQNKIWWKNVQGGVIDIAARQHQAMPAPIEIWQSLAHLRLRSGKVEVEAGIERLRSFLKVNPLTNKPMLLINNVCKGLISECGGGKSPVQNGGAWLRDKNTGKPLSRNNHSTSALIYLLVDHFGYTKRSNTFKVSNYSPFS